MVVRALRDRGRPVRAMVHHDDERADALRTLGAEVIAGDLTRPADVARALDGCRRMYFGMSVSAAYLEAAATVASVAEAVGDLEVLVSISQMTVSQMSAVSTEESNHQRLHFLAERVLDWSGLPVVHLRPTIFLENPLLTMLAAPSVAGEGILRLP
ncbi:MAG TPA: NAD(P)H-binding protein, partial [Acidimicrobiia bacterium]|nr:NAD(P)H-binding protein [Acidimicrobiia bacterium]